ncbi:MAG: DEAD/DEAH box helicase [Bacteroidales bacterium]|nr:DEAD/DEAH box helicase [Bacteroidales bacterium]
MSDIFGSKVLVFAITENPVLGFLIEPFAVSISAKGQFGYDFKKIVKNTSYDYFDSLTSEEIALVDVLDKYNDDNLQKRFNPAHTKTRTFYDKLEPDYVKKHMRPFIDRVLYEVVALMIKSHTPLFYKGDNAERIKEKPLKLKQEIADTCFHFEKLSDKTLYRLQIKLPEKDLLLFNSNAQLIAEKPCLLLFNDELFRFNPELNGKMLEPFIRKEFLEVPQASERQFYKKFVLKSISNHSFTNKGFEVKTFDEKPEPVLKVEEHWQGDIMLALYFRYGKGMVFFRGDGILSEVKFIDQWPRFHFEKLERNFEFENEISEFLKELGLVKKDGPFLTLENSPETQSNDDVLRSKAQIHILIDWLNDHHESIEKKGFVLEKEISHRKYFSGLTELKLESEEKFDWFDLAGKVRFGEFEVPFISLRENILKGDREFGLPDGSIALIPQEWMSMFHDILKFAAKKGDHLQVKKYHFSLLSKLNETGIKIPVFNLTDAKQNRVLPELKNVKMRPYQVAGYNWMMFLNENNLGGCLADDMGLGKTLQALALLSNVHLNDRVVDLNSILYESEEPKPGMQLGLFDSYENHFSEFLPGKTSLIVMPLSLIHNWIEEVKRFSPHLRVFKHTGTNRPANTQIFSNYDLILTTYGTVRNDIEMLKNFYFCYVILDESQIIKNASSKIFSAIKNLHSQNRLVLSGTPVENSLTDLWSQFSFINPGMLGSLNFFRNEFVIPIEKKQDEKAAQKLQKLIRPFILRRTKSQVAKELPDLVEKVHYCEMTPEQESYYETKKSEIRNAILKGVDERGVDKTRFVVLSGLTRLRLIANHPSIVDQDYSHLSGKYTEIIRSVEKLMAEDHKVLIYSQFVKHLNLFKNYFDESNYPYSFLTGNVAEKDRKKVINDFQSRSDIKLFLISLKAGGVGLNLTGADYVFVLDPWWNPAVENQAINRAHRIGQDKNVFVYKFISRNTVEEKILKLQRKKSNIAGMFINQNNPLKSLSFTELQELI